MEPFLSEIVLFSFNFSPRGFTACNGQLLPISQNQALFALLGTIFGGNGTSNFGLPNLRGRAVGHVGNGYTLGEEVGGALNSITIQQLPTHTHEATKSANANYTPLSGATANSGDPNAKVFAGNSNFPHRFADKFDEGLGDQVSAGSQISGPTGGSQPHNNMMPYLVLNYCIALQGIFPSPN
jgi:microcystin-dependent protein